MSEEFEISQTIVIYGEPGSKFYMKKFEDLPEKDLRWIRDQRWCDMELAQKIDQYFEYTPMQRALAKVYQKPLSHDVKELLIDNRHVLV